MKVFMPWIWGNPGVEKACQKGQKQAKKWLIMDEICVFCIFQSQAITECLFAVKSQPNGSSTE